MTNTPVDASSYSEDWSSYRKLVVDTLKRLDDRTMEIYQKFFDLMGRVTALETIDVDKEISRVEKKIESVETDVEELSDNLEDLKVELGEQKGFRQGATWIIGGIWAIASILLSVGLEKIF